MASGLWRVARQPWSSWLSAARSAARVQNPTDRVFMRMSVDPVAAAMVIRCDGPASPGARVISATQRSLCPSDVAALALAPGGAFADWMAAAMSRPDGMAEEYRVLTAIFAPADIGVHHVLARRPGHPGALALGRRSSTPRHPVPLQVVPGDGHPSWRMAVARGARNLRRIVTPGQPPLARVGSEQGRRLIGGGQERQGKVVPDHRAAMGLGRLFAEGGRRGCRAVVLWDIKRAGACRDRRRSAAAGGRVYGYIVDVSSADGSEATAAIVREDRGDRHPVQQRRDRARQLRWGSTTSARSS